MPKISVTKEADGTLRYVPKSFVRNSRDFGVPQNRPRTYIIGFDTERFAPERLAMLPTEMPCIRVGELYHDLNDVLEHDVPPRYYMASGSSNNIGDMEKNFTFFFVFKAFLQPDPAECLAGKSSQKHSIFRVFHLPFKFITGQIVFGIVPI